MADSALLKALMGNEYAYTPKESLSGALASGLGSSLPNLVNPYGSTGSNLASVLGGSLLAGLFGYSAKQEAERKNAEMMPVMLDLLQAKDTGTISDILKTSPYGQRLSPLGIQRMSALEEAQAAQQAAELEREQTLGDFATKLRMQDELLRGRAAERRTFEQQMSGFRAETEKQKRRSILSGAETEAVSSAGNLGNRLNELVDTFKEMSLAELKTLTETGIAPDRFPGLSGMFESTKQLYRKPEFGATLTGNEFNAAQKIFGDKLVAGKDDIIASLKDLANKQYEKAAVRMEVKKQDPEQLVKALREAQKTGKFKLDGSTAIAEAIPTISINKQAAIDYLKTLKMKYQGDLTKVTPEERAEAKRLAGQ